MRWAIGLCAVLVLIYPSFSHARKAIVPQPDRFVIGRLTFFDFGPPSEYYDLFIVRPSNPGTSVERISLTPPGPSACLMPAKLEVASATMSESVAELFGSTNPCAIQDKELSRERKRCKHCLVFSGANVVMQVPCRGQTRLIRSDILDRDMFDPAARTPARTSWTMQLVGRLDKAAGPGVMEKPMFPVSDDKATALVDLSSPVFQDLSAGKYDALFVGASEKASDLFRASQTPPPPPPTVRLVSSKPVAPITFVPPAYPVIARMAQVGGTVTFHVTVDSDGNAIALLIDSGPGLLWNVVQRSTGNWKFAKQDAGKQVEMTIEFRLNCPKPAN